MTEGEWLEYCEGSTDAPSIFHKFSRMVLGAVLLEGRVWMKYGHAVLFPNLWLCIIAASSTFRKSTVLNIVRSLVDAVNEDLVYPQEFSQEKLIDIFSRQPNGVMMAYEFQTLLGILSRDYNAGLRALLTELYDCPTRYQRAIKDKNYEILRPTISLFAATTSDWLLEKTKDADFRGGFLSRFLFVPAFKKERAHYFPRSSDSEKRKLIINKAIEIRSCEGEIILDQEAENHYIVWAKNHEDFESDAEKLPSVLDAYWIRLETAVLKLAMIEACWRGEKEITLEIITEAILKVEILKTSILELYGNGFAFTQDQKDRQIIMAILKKGTTTRQMLLAESQLSLWHFKKAVETMMASGKILSFSTEGGVEHYELIEESGD